MYLYWYFCICNSMYMYVFVFVLTTVKDLFPPMWHLDQSLSSAAACRKHIFFSWQWGDLENFCLLPFGRSVTSFVQVCLFLYQAISSDEAAFFGEQLLKEIQKSEKYCCEIFCEGSWKVTVNCTHPTLQREEGVYFERELPKRYLYILGDRKVC